MFKILTLFFLSTLSLFAILATWSVTKLPTILLTEDIEVWVARFIMVFILVLLLFMVFLADKRKNGENPSS